MRISTRYVIPASAVDRLAAQAAETGGCVDVAQLAAQRRTAREVSQVSGDARW
ncbi:MAG: DNA-binding protein [Actinomycetota bacterium]|nr:DNA-binding protein [Actinomycetota bacterium]